MLICQARPLRSWTSRSQRVSRLRSCLTPFHNCSTGTRTSIPRPFQRSEGSMDKIRFQKVLRRVVLIPLGVAVILAVTLILEVQSFVNRAGWVEHTDQVISIAQRIYRARIDQETGVRAYLLTKDESFLQPFPARTR